MILKAEILFFTQLLSVCLFFWLPGGDDAWLEGVQLGTLLGLSPKSSSWCVSHFLAKFKLWFPWSITFKSWTWWMILNAMGRNFTLRRRLLLFFFFSAAMKTCYSLGKRWWRNCIRSKYDYVCVYAGLCWASSFSSWCLTVHWKIGNNGAMKNRFMNSPWSTTIRIPNLIEDALL